VSVKVCVYPTVRSHDAPVLVGDSVAMRMLRRDIAGAARTSAKVLVVGETGSGKEVVARLVHEQSARRASSFVAVNCSGVAETLLESELFGHTRGSFTGADRDTVGLLRQAHGGTLFLDELGEMSARMQAALLRFTETGEIQQVGSDKPLRRADVRLITATNRDLPAQIAAGAFREDLYYRLNVIQIRVPPLRDRGDDIMVLVRHYLERAAETHGIPVPSVTADAAQLLLGYAWPGNVREVKNITERLVLKEHQAPVTPDDLPAEIRGGAVQGAGFRVETAVLWHKPDARPASAASPASDTSVPVFHHAPAAVDHLWNLMANGHSFWTVVYRAFKAHELTRTELAALIDRGLQETGGSYTALLKVFNLPATDYKRFHAFLYQQDCNLPVASYRRKAHRGMRESAPAERRVA
jgi:DNA-binding NtrC family response regulator